MLWSKSGNEKLGLLTWYLQQCWIHPHSQTDIEVFKEMSNLKVQIWSRHMHQSQRCAVASGELYECICPDSGYYKTLIYLSLYLRP